MKEQEVNRILAEYEGLTPNPNDGGKTFGINSQIMDNELYADLWVTPQYTTDWNDFHRVWMKYVLSDSDTTNLSPILNLITLNTKPSLAAHKLAEVLNQHPSN